MTKKICKICYTSGCNLSIHELEESKLKEKFRYHWKEKNGDGEISFNAESNYMAIIIMQNITKSGTMNRWKCIKKVVIK